MYIDFADVKSQVTIEEVCAWFGLTLKREGSSSRCTCPICATDDKRCFVISHEKQMFHCFKCQKGGDLIQLYALKEKVSVRVAAAAILERAGSPPKEETKELKQLDYLVHEHEKVQALGITPDQAKRLGIGYAPKGTLVGRVAIPQRDEAGKLICYIGIGLHLNPVVKVPKNV